MFRRLKEEQFPRTVLDVFLQYHRRNDDNRSIHKKEVITTKDNYERFFINRAQIDNINEEF